jgi:uncharacterized SAM-binding protein YcdF (DUF218 family)
VDSATLFFALSKILGFFALPTNALVFTGVVGVLLTPTRWGRGGRRLAALSLILLAVIAWSPVSRMLMISLEQRFPPWNPAAGAPDGIVILGGGADGRLSAARGVVVLREGAERLTVGVELARRYPDARLIFSGGSGYLMFPDATEAPFAREFMIEHGVRPERIENEGESRNTVENAVFSKRIANPKPGERWLLVTSAFHMPRSIGVFRKAGFPVEPYPVDWLTAGPDDMWRLADSASLSFRRFDIATREWVGLVVYWLTGRSSELFPGPRRAGCDFTARADGCRP